MATEGLAAALTLDSQIITDAEKMDGIIRQMADASERLAKNFDSFKHSFIDTLNAANGKNFIASFDTSGALKNLQILTEAVTKVNQQQQSTSKAVAVSEESLNKKLESTFSKRADSYAAITQRIKELKDYQEKWDAANKKSVDKDGKSFNVESYQEAGEYLKELEKRLKNFRSEFNIGSAHQAEKLGLAIDDSTYNGALMKLQALTAAEKELLKPAGTSVENADWINQHLKLVQQEIENTKAKLPELKKAANDVLFEDRAKSAKSNFAKAIGLDATGTEELISKIKAVEQAFKELQRESKKNKFISPEEIEEAKAKLGELRGSLAAAIQEMASNKAQAGLDAALNLDDSSVEEMQTKIKEVEKNINKLRDVASSPADLTAIKNGEAQLDSLKNRLEATRLSMKYTTQAASEMGSMIKSAFSAVAVTSFLKNIIQIRGEFEMSEKSIGIIIKDANMAKDIFGQIQNIAVKSPFQIKDLVKQTKQLAAYRIETDKLVETTKMLGDISAGVGVDMNRLILAFGQVKAATYLKGTELRQFSEAGVNMLGGLAERFEEVYHRAVSTGEVLQMISKRMVSFEDVYAVLQKQTQAGGAFYQMQEKQAETLQGRISNLRDKLDIMFNDIGKSTQGLINLVLSLLEFFIERYNYLESLLSGALIYKSVMALFGGLMKITKVQKEFRIFFDLIRNKGAMSFSRLCTAGGPVIALITAILTAVGTLVIRATALRRELNKQAKETAADTEEMVSSYYRLAKAAGDTATSIDEREEAFEELKTQFGNLLPLEKDNIDTVGEGKESYDRYAQAIRAANEELLREKQLLSVEQDAAKNANDWAEKARKALNKASETYYSYGNKTLKSVREWMKDPDEIAVTKFLEVQQRALRGEIATAEEAADEYLKLVSNWYHEEDNSAKRWAERAGQYNKIVRQFKKSFHELELAENSMKYFPTIDGAGHLGQQLAKDIKGIDDYKKKWIEYHKYVRDESGNRLKDENGDSVIDELYVANEVQLQKDADEAVRIYIQRLREALAENKNIKIGEDLSVSIGDSIGGDLYDYEAKFLEDSLKEAEEKLLTPLEVSASKVFSEINRQYKDLAIQFGTGNFILKEGENVKEFMKRMEVFKDAASETIKEYKAWQALPETIRATEEEMVRGQGMTFADAKAQVEAFNNYLVPWAKSFGISLDEGGDDLDNYKDRVLDFVNAVIEGVDELKELDETGDNLLIAKLENSARRLKVSLPDNYKDWGIEEITRWLEGVKKQLGLREEDLFDIKISLNKKASEQTLNELRKEEEQLWNKYETAKHYEELGLHISGFNSAEEYAKLVELEQKYQKVQVEGGTEAAEALHQKRLDIYKQESIEIAELISQSQKNAASEVEQLYKDLFDKLNTLDEGRSKVNEEGQRIFSDEDIDKAKEDTITSYFEKISKAEWDAYKSTEMYAAAFGDLEGLSSSVLQSLLEQFEKFQSSDSLNPSDMRAAANVIEKLRSAMGNKEASNFFELTVNGFKAVGEAARAYSQDMPTLNKAYVSAYDEQVKAYEEYQAAKKEAEADPENTGKQNIAAEKYAKYQKSLESASLALKELKECQEQANTKMQNASKDLDAVISAYNSMGSAMSSIIGFVEEFADTTGLALSDETVAALDGFEKGFALVGSAMSIASAALATYTTLEQLAILKGVELEVVLSELQAICVPLLVIGAAVGTLIAVLKAKDAKLSAAIEDHKDAVEKLESAYEDLEERMNEVLTMADASNTYANMMSNLKQQYIELSEAIALNNQRKQNDEVKEDTEDLLDQLDAVKDKMKEAQEQKMELLGAPSNYQDVAGDWASSWLDSFKETGDGLSALEDSFDDLYDNIIAGQIQSLIMGPAIQKLESMISSALSDYIITDEERQALENYRDTELAVINKNAKELAERLGYSYDSLSTDTLQKGIEGVTEQTAQALESILNSTRYYVADNNRLLQALHDALVAEGGENTILTNIRAQTKYLKTLATIADAVYYSGSHAKGAGGIKVFVD